LRHFCIFAFSNSVKIGTSIWERGGCEISRLLLTFNTKRNENFAFLVCEMASFVLLCGVDVDEDGGSLFAERVFRGSIDESAASGDEVLLNIPLSLASRRGLAGGTVQYRRHSCSCIYVTPFHRCSPLVSSYVQRN